MTETLGQMVKRYRRKRGLNQKELAAAAKMRPAEISELENDKRGARLTSFEKIKRLAKALGITPNDLAGREPSHDPRKIPQRLPLWTS